MSKLILTILFSSVAFLCQGHAQTDGDILEKTEIPNDTLKYIFSTLQKPERFITESSGTSEWTDEWRYLEELILYSITYISDGLKVKGFVLEPKADGVYPAIIANRGGNRDFGMVTPSRMIFSYGRYVRQGYIVIASNYRGVDGGEGIEEFGGADVHDVVNLLPILNRHPKVDSTSIGMFGGSRGGMMTFLAMKETDQLKAVAVVAAAVDLRDETRPEMETNVYAELIPNYWENKEEVLNQRSAITWVDQLPKNVPVLIMHGTADWRVQPESSLKIALELQKHKVPYRLMMIEGEDHGLTGNRDELERQVMEWFDRFLKNKAPLPDLEPHGR